VSLVWGVFSRGVCVGESRFMGVFKEERDVESIAGVVVGFSGWF
jgi:hypothetical protein